MRRRKGNTGMGAVLFALALFALPGSWRDGMRRGLETALERLSQTKSPSLARADSLAVELAKSQILLAAAENKISESQRESLAALDFRRSLPAQLAPKAVSARILRHSDPLSSYRHAWLSAGSSDGVAVGNLVLSGGVLIGKILQVREHRSEARWLIDPESRIKVQVLPPAAGSARPVTAIAQGSLAHGIELILPSSRDWAPGWAAITSPDGFHCGFDLPVGSVLSIEREPGQVLPKARLEPALDPLKAEFVQIIGPDPALLPPPPLAEAEAK